MHMMHTRCGAQKEENFLEHYLDFSRMSERYIFIFIIGNWNSLRVCDMKNWFWSLNLRHRDGGRENGESFNWIIQRVAYVDSDDGEKDAISITFGLFSELI